jgi:hypothetical protein
MSGVYKLTNSSSILRIADQAWIPADSQNADYAKYLEWIAEGNTPDPIDAPIVPDQGSIPPTLVASALNIVVANSDIRSISGIFGLAGAVYLSTGTYMLLFTSAQPDTAYFTILNGGAPCMSVFEKAVDHLIIHSSNVVDGPLVDAPAFSAQIYRIN